MYYFTQEELANMARLALMICGFNGDISEKPQKDRGNLVGIFLVQMVFAFP